MSDKTYSVKSQGQGQTITNLKKYLTLEVNSISDADTVTIDALATVNVAKVVDMSDGAEYDVTLDDNVITIADADCSADHVIILVVGV